MPQLQLGQVITGNGFLFEQDAAQNFVNNATCNQLMALNARTPVHCLNTGGAQPQLQLNRADQSGLQSPGQFSQDYDIQFRQGAVESENEFRFGITVEEVVEKALEDQTDKSEKKSGESKSGESKQMPPRSNARKRMTKDDAPPAENQYSGVDAPESEGQQSNLRSKLMQRRSGARDAKSEPEASASPSENSSVMESIKRPEQAPAPAQQPSDPFQVPNVRSK